ncbi:hypothetical protein E4U49_000806 [Claviceps purpurea]|nr:hypothetical protein E4U49_000806 [Claviceps purpurea]
MKIDQVTDMATKAKTVAYGTIFVLSYWATISYPISMMAYNIRAATAHAIDTEWLGIPADAKKANCPR